MERLRGALIGLSLVILPCVLVAQYGQPRTTRPAGPKNGVAGDATPLVSLRGRLRSISKKNIVITVGDDQIVTLKRIKKTRFLKGAKEIAPDDFPEGAPILIEANRALNGDLDAVNVFLDEPPAKAAPPQ